jgi:hypothetical protein
VHALNTLLVGFEVLCTNTPPMPWLYALPTFLCLAAYLGVAYITHATQGFYSAPPPLPIARARAPRGVHRRRRRRGAHHLRARAHGDVGARTRGAGARRARDAARAPGARPCGGDGGAREGERGERGVESYYLCCIYSMDACGRAGIHACSSRRGWRHVGLPISSSSGSQRTARAPSL